MPDTFHPSRIPIPFGLPVLVFCFLAAAASAREPAGEWKKHVVLPAEKARGSINTVLANDFDGDGSVDIISSFSGEVVLLKGPDWKRRVTVHRIPSSRPGRGAGGCIHSTLLDVDGDGDQDFCGSAQGVFWLECPDKPFSIPWPRRNVDSEIKGTHCLITGDVDRDGKPDLIANSGRGPGQTPVPESITWQKIPADPLKAKSWIRNVFAVRDAPGASHYTGFGDVDGDGRPDISCAAKGGEKFPGGEWFAWWRQPEDPTRPWKKHLLSGSQPGATNIHPVDLDGDGRMDFFATRGHTRGVLWFKGPDFRPIEIDPEIEGPHSLATVDLDADGDIDAATCGRLNTGIAVWYENNGKGVFRRHLIGRDQGSYDLRTVDLDGDGDLDILIAGHSSANIVWYENPLK